MKIKIISIIAIVIMFITTMPMHAYSSSIDDSTVFMSDKELQSIETIFDSWEQRMGNIELEKYLPQYSILSTGVTLGTDKTVYPTAGKVYTSDEAARTDAAQGGTWLDCRTEYLPFASGSGYAWGWIGEYITVSGSGSRGCNIIINGRYDGQLEALEINGVPIDSNAFASLYLQVYDVTTGFNLVKEQKVFQQGVVFTLLPWQINGTLGSSQKINCTLQAGRNYLIRASLRTEADCGISNSGDIQVWGLSDFASNPKGANGQGLDVSSIKIDWI